MCGVCAYVRVDSPHVGGLAVEVVVVHCGVMWLSRNDAVGGL